MFSVITVKNTRELRKRVFSKEEVNFEPDDLSAHLYAEKKKYIEVRKEVPGGSKLRQAAANASDV
jgi:hypothetical protein